MGFGDRMRARAPISLFLLPIAGAAAIDQIFTTSDEVAAPGTETMLEFSDHVQSFVNPVWTSLSGNDLNTTSPIGKQSDISHEKDRRLPRSFPPAIHLEHHPCENFSFSPPPIDRKCTGPRPCPVCYVP